MKRPTQLRIRLNDLVIPNQVDFQKRWDKQE
jgi:hypothetical protein